MNDLAIIQRDGFSICLTEAAHTLRERALSTAALVGAVRNEDENSNAAAAMLEIKTVLKQVEEARKTVKEPVLDLCRKIDSTAKEFVADLAAEEIRIGKAVGNYQQEQLETQRAAARKAAEEAARIERERADEARRIQEEAAKAAQGKTDAEIAAIAQETAQKLVAVHERSQQALQAVTPAVSTAPRAEGQCIRPVLKFEVTNIWDLVKARPDLVLIEVRKQATNEAIALLAAAGTPKIPGLRIWEEVAVTTRVGSRFGTNKQKTLEV